MSQVTGPFPLVAGQSVSVPMPSSSPWESVVLSNLSPFLLQITGGAAVAWLQPFTENIFPSPASHQPLQIAAQLPAGTPANSEAGSQLQATWYSPGETPQGAWPIPLLAAAITAAIAGLTFTDGALNINVSLIEGVTPVSPDLIVGSITIASTAVSQQFPSVAVQRGVTFYADPNNAATGVGIGDSAGQPITLLPGAWGPGLPITDTSLVWAEGTAGDVVSYIGV